MINQSVVTGDITLSLTTDLTAETGAVALNEFASPYTITIKPSGGQRILSGSNTGALIKLNGADRVTIDGSLTTNTRDLTISNTNTGTSSAVIWMQTATGSNSASNNTVMNCNVSGSGPAGTLFGIGSGRTTISITSLGSNNNSNSFINNNVSSVQYGIYSMGASLANKNANTLVSRNLINTLSPSNVGKGGIYIGYDNNVTVSENTVSEIVQTGSPDVFGISLGYGPNMTATSTTSFEVSNASVTKNTIGNVINSGTFSASGISLAGATTGTNTIANNMVYGVASNGTSGDFGGGIVVGGGSGSTTRVYYNTVSMQGTVQGATAGTQTEAAFAVVSTTAPLLDIRNNIFSNTQLGNTGSTAKFAAVALGYSSTAGNYANLISDYNDLYVGGAGPGTYTIGVTGGIVGTNRITLADWQTETGKDANSFSYAPAFTSLSNLHIPAGTSTRLESGGVVIGGFTTDFDNDSRPGPSGSVNGGGSAPDLGADEFDGTPLLTNDMAATALISPTNGGTIAINTSITPQASFTNVGLSAQTNVTVRYRIISSEVPSIQSNGNDCQYSIRSSSNSKFSCNHTNQRRKLYP